MAEWRDSDPLEEAMRLANERIEDLRRVDELVGRAAAVGWLCACKVWNSAEDKACDGCGAVRPDGQETRDG